MPRQGAGLAGNGIIARGVISGCPVRVLQAADCACQGLSGYWRRGRGGTPRIVGSPQRTANATCPAPKAPAEPTSYESALQELEQLIAQIESGQLPLEQMLAGYQRAAQLLGYCRGQLDAVQEQVKVLDEGTLAPWSQD